jgi:hypothetical protein
VIRCLERSARPRNTPVRRGWIKPVRAGGALDIGACIRSDKQFQGFRRAADGIAQTDHGHCSCAARRLQYFEPGSTLRADQPNGFVAMCKGCHEVKRIIRKRPLSFAEYLMLVSSRVPELTPEELAAMLEKLDGVCRQAQELSADIRKKMADTKRGDYQSDDVGPTTRRAVSRKKR